MFSDKKSHRRKENNMISTNYFRLGRVYDVTERWKKAHPGDDFYANGFFVCDDVWDFHTYRIVVGLNSMYEDEPETKLVEMGNIPKRYVLRNLDMESFEKFHDLRDFPGVFVTQDDDELNQIWFKKIIDAVIDEDCGDNEDLKEYRFDAPMSELLYDIDGGYGIHILDEDLNFVKEWEEE